MGIQDRWERSGGRAGALDRPGRRLRAIERSAERLAAVLLVFVLAWLIGPPVRADASPPLSQANSHEAPATPFTLSAILEELALAGVRLPLATALGAVLALRPRRPGTPVRQPAVVQTQIVLAIVGAVIMLIVGASLARAFGIVGVASLIRYRSKIDDPKDAVVMLAALAVGLASGVGLFPLAIFATLFLFAALYVIEGFEPQTRQFELKVKLGSKTPDLRGRVETLLRRYRIEAELRGTSEDEVVFLATVPLTLDTDRVSNALVALAQDGKGAIEWNEKPKAKQK